MNRAYLPSLTNYGGKLKSLQVAQMAHQHQQQAEDPNLETRRVLGAKFLFTSELQRTHDVNAEIKLTGAILEVVRRATAVDPGDRYPDAAAMRAAVDALLARAKGGR